MFENEYDRIVESIPFLDTLDAMVLERIEANSSVLELGTGTGLLTEKLAQKGCTLLSVDPYEEAPSHQAIAEERIKTYPNARIERRSALEFEGVFDCIVSRLTYHHVIEKESLIRKCHELLRPGGLLLVADVFIPDAQNRTEAVECFHDYRVKIAELGITPVEEGIREQDLVEDGEYKTSKRVLESQLRSAGFEHILQTPVTGEHQIDYELLGYALFEARKRMGQE